jgi:putative endopeptidase
VAKIADIYDRTPLAVLQAWQAFHTADAAAEVLPHDFVVAQFEFRERTLAGQPQIQVRWKRAVKAVDGELGDAVGRLYVARYFPPRSKAQAQTLVGDLKAAFAARIRHLDWMSPDTKTQALAKLAAMEVQIGYPSRWRDYGGLAVRPDDPYGNATRAMAFDWAYQVRRLAGPVDRNAWELTPQTINAYNEPLLNVLVFPAAILQPPFFDPAADPAINFGGLGGVIGHEMTHGFDDQGRRFDARGGLRDWWAASDSARFEAQAKRLAAQYSALEALPGVHLNGELTLGENIADLGGLSIALDAYHASLRGKPAPTIDGFTGDQRVFLGWAQKWRQKLRPELLRQVVAADPHAPPTARVNGVVRNMDGWYGAYGVKPGDKLYLPPAERVRIW